MLLIAVVSVMMFEAVQGSPGGAPASACDSMTPNHGTSAQASGTFPYSISPASTTYRCGETITVTLSGGTFKGFLCQARTDAADANTKVGTLTATGSVIMNQNCGAGLALTHSENGDKTAAEFNWEPSADHGSVYIVCTVVQAKTTYWVRETSTALTYDGNCGTTPSSAGHVAMSAGILLLMIIIHLLKFCQQPCIARQ